MTTAHGGYFGRCGSLIIGWIFTNLVYMYIHLASALYSVDRAVWVQERNAVPLSAMYCVLLAMLNFPTYLGDTTLVNDDVV